MITQENQTGKKPREDLIDVEQIAHAFLEKQGRRKSQRKIKGGCQ